MAHPSPTGPRGRPTDGMASSACPLPASPIASCVREIAYALADELVFTNENQMEFMLATARIGRRRRRAEGRDRTAPHLAERFLLHGRVRLSVRTTSSTSLLRQLLYATRGLDDVLGAIAALDEWSQSRLRYTSSPQARGATHSAEALGIGPSCGSARTCGFLEFLNLTAQFDCLFVTTRLTEAATRTSVPAVEVVRLPGQRHRGVGRRSRRQPAHPAGPCVPLGGRRRGGGQ